jgi:hypothetical protein
MTRVLSNKVPPDVGAVSPITYPRPQSHIPPLFELCIRVLVSPYLAFTTGAETNLAELYTLPIPGEWGSRRVPVPVEEILNACIPGSVSVPKTMSPRTPQGHGNKPSLSNANAEEGEEVMGTGVCPNPSHWTKAVFARHMEERFTWEKLIAGHVVIATPIRWRGCSKGCLDFLDSGKVASRCYDLQQDLENHSADTQMTMFDVDDDVEMEDLVVRPVSLARTEFGDEDFEDEA